MTSAESENRFDDLLRQKLAADEVQPSAGLWPAVSATLPVPPPRPRGWAVGAAALLGVVLGLLLGWWSGGRLAEKGPFQRGIATGDAMMTSGSDKMVVGSDKMVVGSAATTIGNDMLVVGNATTPIGSGKMVVGSGKMVVGSALAGPAGVVAPVPGTGAGVVTKTPSPWQTAFAQDSAIRQEAARGVAPVRTDSASRLLDLIAAQRATLRGLQGQLDSLKAALPVEPLALAIAADSVTPVAPQPDSIVPTAPLHRWAVALLAETTPRWGALPGPADTYQPLGATATRGLQLEHRLANDRWLVRGGLGETRLTGQFRAIAETTRQRLVSDTLTTTVFEGGTRVDTIRILQLDSTLHLNPRVNANLQIIGYDSLWVPDTITVYQLVISHDTVQRTTQTVRTRLDTWRETREQQLRPTYRFWTIPVAAQFDVLRAGRWRAGLSLGAQLTVFRGGDAPVRGADGTYALRRIGARGGPFRPLSVALTTGLDVRYHLTDRLSVLAGGGLRGWVQSPVRGEARPKVQPTAQVGISWGLGR